MIDWVKVFFEDKERIDRLIRRCGELTVLPNGKVRYIMKCYNLKFVSTETTSYMEGSLHSYYNCITGNGKQNYNDFTYMNLLTCLKALGDYLDYDMRATRITVLEFGFNLTLQMSPSDFIDKYILMYKYKYPCFDPKNKDMKIKKFEYNNYIIKVYDKSRQYGLKEKILRIEIVYRTDEFKKCGIQTLADLKKYCSLMELYDDFMGKYEHLTMVENYAGNIGMPENDIQAMIKYTNPSFWLTFDDASKYSKKEKGNAKERSKKAFESIVKRYALDTVKTYYLKSLISKKFQALSPH